MKLNSLRDLLVDHLKDLYDAEHQLTEALPKMVKAASSPKLKEAFEEHLKKTNRHVERLERAFELLDQKPARKKCKGMEGLIKEGEEMVEAQGEADVKDAGLIAAAQKVEHYEIAAYGTVRTYAQLMGHDNLVTMMQNTLDEEGEADHKLTRLAEEGINLEALEHGR